MRSTTVRRAALIGLLTLATCAPVAQADDTAPGGGGTSVSSMAPAAPTAQATPAAAAPAAPVTVSETQTVKLTRTQTKSVQRRAHVRADGSLGSRTRTAIKRYQRKKRLKRTGRPNLQTLRAMKLKFAGTIAAQMAAKQRSVAPIAGYVFPIQGPWHFGDAGTFFGERGGAHEGIDLFATCGTPLVAASAGTIKAVKWDDKGGNYVVITGTPSGEDQVYMHMKAPSPLKVGDAVTAGSPVGMVGDTGNANGCHLHLEIWTSPGYYSGGKPRDPKPDVAAWGGVPSR
ncbi:M23 family metallopeptidase [Patulibacter sp.]|uniref:M23 family metallopeptidase n=1 Tax=Patulibacter sp. TaxID=1912859 RepID=UPI00271DE3BC|nr:M23 family metallopeptidase [Patulibacter sp.]MDO9408048.1 peptidoglycan DD-metalloendopeptidase family protein [Patulibacter sp.]